MAGRIFLRPTCRAFRAFTRLMHSVANAWRTKRDAVHATDGDAPRALRQRRRTTHAVRDRRRRQRCTPRRCMLLPALRHRAPWLWRRAEVSAHHGARFPAAPWHTTCQRAAAGHRDRVVAGHGAGRDLRSARLAALRDTPPIAPGSCRTSRRCSTTMPCWRASACTSRSPPAAHEIERVTRDIIRRGCCAR